MTNPDVGIFEAFEEIEIFQEIGAFKESAIFESDETALPPGVMQPGARR